LVTHKNFYGLASMPLTCHGGEMLLYPLFMRNSIKRFKPSSTISTSPKTKQQGKTSSIRYVQSLPLHAQLEEEIFYPAVRKAIDNTDLMDKAMVEHTAAKHLIHELEAMQSSDALYKAKFTILGEYVNHHIEEEQAQIFPKVKEAKIDLESLGREMANYKQELKVQQFEEDTGIIDELEQSQKDPDQL
jgi:hemerythrin superfamily protein